MRERGRLETELVGAFVAFGNDKVKGVALGVTEVRWKM